MYEEYHLRKTPIHETRGSTVRPATIWWILTACCIAAFLLHNHLQQIKNFLLPGDPEVTKAAISAFADDLRSGESVNDAFTEFCLEIIKNA